MSKLATHYFDCVCSSPEHTIRFILYKNSDDPELWLEVYLNDYRGFFKRLWYGLKYILGFKSRHGAWDIWTIRPADCKRLRDLIDEYEQLETARLNKPR